MTGTQSKFADETETGDSIVSAGGGDDDDAPGESDRQLYIALKGVSPETLDDRTVEVLEIEVANLALAELGLPVEDIRIVQDPHYVVEFRND